MVQISRYPAWRQLRADASSHIQYFRKGTLKRAGRGLSFWFRPDDASIAEVPMDDRQMSFLLKGLSTDFQELTVQGSVIWRVVDPGRLGERIDFTINLNTGQHNAQPLEQINNVLVALVQQFTYAYLKKQGVRALLEAGVAPLQETLTVAFAGDQTLAGMGLELVGINVAGLAPSSELSRALQAPTYESLQQQADEATFTRRALAVEKERAIAENELSNQIELAARQKELIAREVANTQSKAEGKAAAAKVHTQAEADRIRMVDQANADMERARIEIYQGLPPTVLLAMAALEFSKKVEQIDNLTVTPDMLAGLVNQMQGFLGAGNQAKGVEQ